jgi:RimJ/RimL family protein N-acetyltransferase
MGDLPICDPSVSAEPPTSFPDYADSLAEDFFPCTLPGFPAITLRRLPWEAYLAATEELRQRYFTTLGPLEDTDVGRSDALSTRALRIQHFLERHAEYLVFTSETGETWGWFQGEMLDHETFYMRNGALVPQIRGTGFARVALRAIINYLQRLGYARIVSHHLVSNAAALLTVLREGFVVSGVVVDERLGVHVEMLYLVDPRRRAHAQQLLGGQASNTDASGEARQGGVERALQVRPYDAPALAAALACGYEIRGFASDLDGSRVTLAPQSNRQRAQR